MNLSDPRYYHRGNRQQGDQIGKGRAAAVVSDEDGWLQQRERTQLHHVLARRTRLQRHHTQTQTRADTVREAAQEQSHTQLEQRLQRRRGKTRTDQAFGC